MKKIHKIKKLPAAPRRKPVAVANGDSKPGSPEARIQELRLSLEDVGVKIGEAKSKAELYLNGVISDYRKKVTAVIQEKLNKQIAPLQRHRTLLVNEMRILELQIQAKQIAFALQNEGAVSSPPSSGAALDQDDPDISSIGGEATEDSAGGEDVSFV